MRHDGELYRRQDLVREGFIKEEFAVVGVWSEVLPPPT